MTNLTFDPRCGDAGVFLKTMTYSAVRTLSFKRREKLRQLAKTAPLRPETRNFFASSAEATSAVEVARATMVR